MQGYNSIPPPLFSTPMDTKFTGNQKLGGKLGLSDAFIF